MDLVVKQASLLKELQYVQGVVERRTTMPILSNLLLETSGNRLLVTATDLDVTLRCACSATVKVSGAISISARKMFDIVRLLPDADIHFKVGSQDWLSVSCERSRFKVAGLSKENFPDIPSVSGKAVALPAGPLRYMIGRTTFAITQEESRYTLNGALMLVNPTGIAMVATDGHRLVLIKHRVDISGAEGEVRVLVPKKTLVELGKLAGDGDANVEFGHSENHLFFRSGERLLVSRILTGQFPNYEMVIPRENDKEVVVETTVLADALRRAVIMADEQSHAVKFQIREGEMDVSSVSADYGEAKETLPITYSGNPLEIGFNGFYLLDFLNGLETDEVELLLRDRETQGLLRPRGSEDFDSSYVVMPLKI